MSPLPTPFWQISLNIQDKYPTNHPVAAGAILLHNALTVDTSIIFDETDTKRRL